MGYRIYPTLVEQYLNYQAGKYNLTEQDVINSINRVERPVSEAAHKGKAYHKLTENKDKLPPLRKEENNYFYDVGWWQFKQSPVDEIIELRSDGIHEVYVEKPIDVNGISVLLYGYIDTLKNGNALELKTTGYYRGISFLDSFQKLVYLYCTNVRKFRFIITDFEFVFFEDYYPYEYLVTDLVYILYDFIQFLENDQIRPHITDKKLFSFNP